MKQSRFTEERIIAILREHEAGSKTGDVCRQHGISSATFYKWKAKYGGLDVSEARRLKILTDENAKLKKLLAEAMLDNHGSDLLHGRTNVGAIPIGYQCDSPLSSQRFHNWRTHGNL
jgi:putative transposase